MAMKEMRVAVSPEHTEVAEPHEMHIVKKYNKFHGHVKMSDGGEHHAPPHASMHEAASALMQHLGAGPAEPSMAQAEPGMEQENA
jgi:hypothetical protein